MKNKGLAIKCISFLMAATCLLCGQAFALSEVPVSQTNQNVDGKQLLTKVFEVDPSVDPESLKEDGIEIDGYRYSLTSFTKDIIQKEDSIDVSQEQTVALKSTKEMDAYIEALKLLPATVEYDQDGYAGKLNLMTNTIEISETGRSSHSGTQKVTRTFTCDYNDESLVPSTVTVSGSTYKRSSITWADGRYGEDGTIPENYVATAVYTKGYSYTTVDGYQATATYSGEVEAVNDEMVRYTLQYTGEPIKNSPLTTIGHAFLWVLLAIVVIAAAIAIYTMVSKALANKKLKKEEQNATESEQEVKSE